jgi:hypothetical protein
MKFLRFYMRFTSIQPNCCYCINYYLDHNNSAFDNSHGFDHILGKCSSILYILQAKQNHWGLKNREKFEIAFQQLALQNIGLKLVNLQNLLVM